MPEPKDPENQPAPETVAWDPSEIEAGHQGIDPDDPLVGSLIREKWRVLSRIGAGSFGTVYKVRDETGGWIEALKILRIDRLRGPEGEATRARFLREARIMKRLGSRSRHIVRLSTYEEDAEAGLIYFLMEHVEGHNLAEILNRDGPLPIERVVDVTLQVCDALIAAHESEPPVVHRDLKLQNLMLTGDDDGGHRVMVLDFGIAKIAASELDSRLTTTGAIGTPGYASPEQIRAEAVDGRTDLFALGVIMYALLTARDPWLGNLAHEPTDQVYRLMAATDRGEVLPMEEFRADVPPTLVQIVKRLLRREADERFQSARDVRDALFEFAGINTRDFPAYSTRDRLPPMPKGSGGDTIPERRLAAVWFADLVGYSSLSATDEGAALALLDTFHATARKVIEAGGGRVVQFIGDAAFAEFSSTDRAVRTAVRFHEEFALATEENEPQPKLRTGVHVGDVLMASNGDLFGDGVNVASRIQNDAEPGQILVSQDVWRQLKQRRDFHFASIGERSLKGLGSPVWLFAVVPPDQADLTTQDTGALHTDSPMVGPQARKDRVAHIAGVAVAHLTASGVMLYASTVLESRFGLPAWITPVAGILLAVGLVIVLVTSWMQTRPTWERPVSSHGPWSLDLGDVFRSLRAGRLPELTWARTIVGGLAAFTMLFAIAGGMTTGAPPGIGVPTTPAVAGAPGSAGLAILPFRLDGANDALAEGLPDLMAYTAADAGIVTTPSLVLHRRLGATVPTNVAEVGRIARAVESRFAITGEARESAGTLALSATLLDARTGEQIRTASAEGPAERLGPLVAGLTAELLEGTPLDTNGDALDATPASESEDALLAYIDGERNLRDSEWSDAVAAFARARDADPDFALALSRLAFARALASAPGPHVRDADATRALELDDRLPTRDQRLVQGLVLLAEGSRDAIGVFNDLTRRYPSDPDAWYLLGDAIYHIEGTEGADYREPLERSIELAGNYEPAYAHLIAAAMTERDFEGAQELMTELRGHDPESVFLDQFEEPIRVATAAQGRPPATDATGNGGAATAQPPSPRPAVDPLAGARTAYGQLTGSVETDRSRVLALDPHPALSARLGELDGLRTQADEAAAADDFERATALQEQARNGYAELSRDAAVLDRYAGDLAALTPLRRDARDPAARSEAESLEQDAARAVTQGRYSEAVTLVGRARTAWIRAAEAPPAQDTAPAPPPRPAPGAVAAQVLERLSAAIEAEDMGRVRAVWTSIASEAAQGLEALFSGASDMGVTYDVRSVREQGQRIVVSVHTTYRFNMRGDQVAETEQEFELEERNGEWVVVADR